LLETGAVQWIHVPPAAHLGAFGNLAAIATAAGWDNTVSTFVEDCWTSLVVGEQRFTEPEGRGGLHAGQSDDILGGVLTRHVRSWGVGRSSRSTTVCAEYLESGGWWQRA
jgi:hypothetical protein